MYCSDEKFLEDVGEVKRKKPVSAFANEHKVCSHKFIYIEKRRVVDREAMNGMTKIVDVFYCEKCLEYRYVDVIE